MNTPPSSARPQLQHGGTTLRRNRGSWMLFRIVLGFGGAALVLLPVASGNNYAFSVAGLVMFIVAILLPARERTSIEEKASELGALAVVDGGRYRLPDSSSSVPVQLFIGKERICALDGRFQQLVEIPTAEVTSFLALQAESDWYLEVIWSTHAAEFFYRGASGERLAREAENAIRRVAPPASEVPQRRAASA